MLPKGKGCVCRDGSDTFIGLQTWKGRLENPRQETVFTLVDKLLAVMKSETLVDSIGERIAQVSIMQ